MWQFGDGNTATNANPSHTYAVSGTYNVCLIATNSCGADTLCQLVTVVCPLPVATSLVGTGAFFQFTNTSTTSSNFQSYWEFGDGNSSIQTSPSHTYAGNGAYTVCLSVTDTCGIDSACQSLAILSTSSLKDIRISIYPQPANESVSISWNANHDPLLSMQVFALDGKLLRDFYPNELVDGVLKIDTKTWASGVYFLRIQALGSVSSQRLIIAR